MKRKISYLVVLPLLSVFLISEINNLNGNTFINTKVEDNPYIIDSKDSITIIENSETQHGAKISLEVYDNASQYFLNTGNKYIDIHNIAIEDESKTIVTLLTYIQDESDVLNHRYVFEFNIDGILPSSTYIINKISNPGFAYEENTNELLNSLFLNGKQGTLESEATFNSITDLEFTTKNETKQSYPLIKTKEQAGGNPLHDINYSNNVLTFELNGSNLENTPPLTADGDNGNLLISLENSQGNFITTEADLVQNNSDGSYTYEITDELQNDNYTFSSILNSDITVFNGSQNGYAPSSTIKFEDDLGMLNNDLTFYLDNGAVTNPYITTDGFSIDQGSATANSIKFTLIVADNFDNSFKNRLEQNEGELSISLLENGANSDIDSAIWLGDSENNKYTFIIDGLESSTNYELVSLDNTGLAVGDSSSEIDNSISIKGDLSSNGDFSTGASNPYIESNGFSIVDNTVTSYSIDFQINVNDDNDSFIYESGFLVTLQRGGTREDHFAHFVKQNGNSYQYQINDLDAYTSYSFYSLNNTGLAVGDGTSDIDNQIILGTDINSGTANFTTLQNPYINPTTNNGFVINNDSIKKDSVEFTLYVSNWDVNNTSYENNDMKVSLIENGKTKTYDTEFVEHEQGQLAYVYRITGLEDGHNYEFYSLIDSGLAASANGEIEDEIVISTLGIEDQYLNFATTDVFNFLWLLFPIIVILIALVALGYYLWTKSRKNESTRLKILSHKGKY